MYRLLPLLILATLVGCQSDPCDDVNCHNGTCHDGNCICEPGFDGPTCLTEQRQAFVGSYSVDESCDLGNFDYDITISANSEVATELTIHNIGDFDFDVTATVNGPSIMINHDTENGVAVVGSGVLENGILSISYTMNTSANQTLNCDMVCTPI